ncbi:MAG: reverse transcriptase N-terminal domain-containing protein [Trichodesmium sp. St16_bin4-tuft]|uniref:reverse transcriptase N-terminal domain-containing protein n=1 Tax=Trichodesmium erythraeum TaxID=1206 RepID=UPI0003105E14|nr:reverse transcriptase N-terminal domain-containing protein [Trichodesmium sp. St4_bin8_1]MDE5074135.1 reverse transcriptase N-terminal domain-containing protein [Trichodesmium sp. St5_bin8]MDE5078461.1 reverse transcriptase N-terminal domain-containing protein [Trichodesmium sp. St2_bin6]MDE5093430.1 reverse transcriptase N-terminal domain-containing protein [Trichodesmium sp. St11_bin5]MDE5097326.1 reverse transcriptase N-terminal domain-containing protein [Trichodesmium sp. St16_bin4-tuft]
MSIKPKPKWKDINWKWVLKNVFKLQKLIYRASISGNICKMHKYKKILTSSYYARLIAVRRLT